MNNPFDNPPPPIASPFGAGSPPPVAPLGSRDWKSAPKIVKGWAYPLTWLAIIFSPLLIIMALTTEKDATEGIILAVIYGLFFCLEIWLNYAMRKGLRAAWVVQIVLSGLGLLAIPVGTAIHGYILSQWFSPEVKSWFGRS